MLIILEGADCSGKTTLAADIFLRLKASFPKDNVLAMHAGPPTKHPYDEYMLPLAGYTPGSETHWVIDRWHWGEMVYPAILNRKTDMTPNMFRWLDDYFRWLGAICVLLDPPLNVLYKRMADRGDEMIQISQLAEIKEHFRRIARTSVIAPNYIGTTWTPDSIIANAMGNERKAIERMTVPWRSQQSTDN